MTLHMCTWWWITYQKQPGSRAPGRSASQSSAAASLLRSAAGRPAHAPSHPPALAPWAQVSAFRDLQLQPLGSTRGATLTLHGLQSWLEKLTAGFLQRPKSCILHAHLSGWAGVQFQSANSLALVRLTALKPGRSLCMELKPDASAALCHNLSWHLQAQCSC